MLLVSKTDGCMSASLMHFFCFVLFNVCEIFYTSGMKTLKDVRKMMHLILQNIMHMFSTQFLLNCTLCEPVSGPCRLFLLCLHPCSVCSCEIWVVHESPRWGKDGGVKTSFPYLSPFSLYCNVVVLVLVASLSFLSGSLATFGLGRFLTACVQIGPPPVFLSLSACWLAQVSPCPRMPLHPQQPSAFGLQLPETVPELLCLCSHAHLHRYAQAGKKE